MKSFKQIYELFQYYGRYCVSSDDISIYDFEYNLLEHFVPLIGGGEFRWHFKHLSDHI